MGLDEGEAELAERAADALPVLHPDLEEELLRLASGLAYRHRLIILVYLNT